MSIRIQRRIPAIWINTVKMVEVPQATLAKPAKAEVDFFVNLYQDAHGNIEQGSRTFRQERNAIAHGRDTESLEYVGTLKFTASLEV